MKPYTERLKEFLGTIIYGIAQTYGVSEKEVYDETIRVLQWAYAPPFLFAKEKPIRNEHENEEMS